MKKLFLRVAWDLQMWGRKWSLTRSWTTKWNTSKDLHFYIFLRLFQSVFVSLLSVSSDDIQSKVGGHLAMRTSHLKPRIGKASLLNCCKVSSWSRDVKIWTGWLKKIISTLLIELENVFFNEFMDQTCAVNFSVQLLVREQKVSTSVLKQSKLAPE